MNKFVVGKVGDIQEGQKKRVLAGEQAIMLALVEGKYFAVQDKCAHMGASLSGGELDEFRVTCPWHGAQFDIRTGEVKALPAALPLKTFQVEIADGNIIVEVE